MGSGSFTPSSFKSYSKSVGRTVTNDGRVDSVEFKQHTLSQGLNPMNVMRECVNTEEHPNTVPVILALDVTGSMGAACEECAKVLGNLMENLYKQFQDIEILVMGIGDCECDRAPIQMSQFESDVRIAQWLDQLYMEKGGGGNGYESYSAAWYMGLKHTKLDCFDKQGRKGIIITMGDEPLNPVLFKSNLNRFVGDSLEKDVDTKDLYAEASQKFNIFHINVNHGYWSTDRRIEPSFRNVIGDNFVVSDVKGLADTICRCIASAMSGEPTATTATEEGITW